EFIRRHLAELGGTMPELLARLQEAARLGGRTLPPLPTPAEGSARFEALLAYLDRYGRPDDAPPAPQALDDILRTVVALARPELERRARVVERYDAAPPVFAAARA